MKNTQRFLNAAKQITIAAALVFALAQCTNEQDMIAPAEETITHAESITAETDEVASLSVQGIYTEVAESIDCATCTFVVDKNTTTVDGKILGFKPGSVICLQTGVRYSAIDFINMEGTEQNPIVISYCKN